MLLIIFAAVVLNVFGQRIPDYFDKRDYEYRDFKQRSPYEGGQNKERDLLENQTKQPFKVPMWVYDQLDYQLEKYNKYEEFKEFTDEVKEKTRLDPSRTVQDEMKEILQWSKNLNAHVNQRGPQLPQFGFYSQKKFKPQPPRPSPGMSPYWAETELPKKPVYPTPQKLTGKEAMKLALRNLEAIDAIDNKSPMEKFPEAMNNLPKSLPIELLQASITPLSKVINKLPQKDDYNSPIRWVSLDSNDTRDGLAKVTDPRTGRNRQLILNETIYVPVIDYNIERLGLTTTTPRPVLTTDKRILKTVLRSVDLKNVDERDWLAFESALGGRNNSDQCDGDSCQSRCTSLACESFCNGDTCASGCIGSFCNTFCKGPGCWSMCIGEGCTAKCEGLSCDSRCRGENCNAGCRTFSCTYVVNGRHGRGGGSWNDHYPQYDDRNIRNTQY